MRKDLLEKFKREAYSKLTEEEKKNLIIQTIRSIQSENDLSEVEIEFRDETFGFDSQSKKVIIDLVSDDPYVMLTGIIHELRHQWQIEKGNFNPLNTSGRDYILSPHEMDAHEYAISQMQKYSDFFNEEEFDLYLIDLKEKFLSKKNDAIYDYKRSGYDDVEKISRKMSLYKEQAALFTTEELQGTEKEQMVRFDDGVMGACMINENNHNILLRIPGIVGTVIGNDLYINMITVKEKLSTNDFACILQRFIEYLDVFKDIGIDIHCDNIHFPPAIVGMAGLAKDEYDNFLRSLNCRDGMITVENLYAQNFDKDHVLRRTINMWPEGKEMTFGINYLQEYTDEQVKVLDMAKKWELDLDDLKHPLEDDEEDEIEKPETTVIGFFAAYQYQKEYSPQKLRLILAGQKHGLDTLYYDGLDEKQIEQLMILQLEGFKRKDWIKIIQSGLDIAEARRKLEESRPDITIISELNLDDDCNIVGTPRYGTNLIADAVKATEAATTTDAITAQQKQIISQNEFTDLESPNNVPQQ